MSQLESLVGPFGLVNQIHALEPFPGEPDFPIRIATMGDISYTSDHIARATMGRSIANDMDGAGGDLQESQSRIKAIAEALERYSSCMYDEEQFIWATPNELGDEAMDLRQVPIVSDKELAHPKCLVNRPQMDAPLRWVKGMSLHTQKETWIPAIMTYLHLPAMSTGERFWLPISTGCAAHTSYEQALVNGINEVVERDAISLTWYQQLPLPHIVLDEVDERMQSFLDRTHQTNHLKQYLFDGTSDLGIPTIYSLQLTPENDKLGALIMCATHLNPEKAINKVMREAASSRIAMMHKHNLTVGVDDFHDVFHGASYMAEKERLHAYDFLVNSENRVLLSELENKEHDNPADDLIYLLDQLEAKGFEAFAVDLTTDEAFQAGMRIVRVIIPGLQPLSFSYRSRFLAHPRLYDGPRAMGYEPKQEDDINPWPQPFA